MKTRPQAEPSMTWVEGRKFASLEVGKNLWVNDLNTLFVLYIMASVQIRSSRYLHGVSECVCIGNLIWIYYYCVYIFATD